ncbi:MAG: hypothetical protein ACT4OV_11150 [Microthrixaceae bacterium]
MAAERFVVLGLAQARSSWFRELSRWATSASLPVEFLKSMSLEEVRVRLRAGRGLSALLIDDSIPGLDRDLVELAREAGCAVVLVESGRAAPLRTDLGASGLLAGDFTRGDLMHLLAQVAMPLARAGSTAEDLGPRPVHTAGYRADLVSVVGAGGTGTSTVAMALAQGLTADPRRAEQVCLADLALHADLAMLHDTGDVVPGLLELVDAHRGGSPTVETIRSLTWRVESRGYHLLLGLRRHRDWTSLRPRAFEAALDGLRRAFRVVVADVDHDLEGERATGSADVEDRNLMARITCDSSDLVVVVGAAGLTGVHGMLRVTRDLLELGVEGQRILPVVNHAPRGPRARAEHTRAFGDLLAAEGGADRVPSPIFLGARRHLDDLLRDGGRLPAAWVAAVCTPVRALLDRDERERLPQAGSAHEPTPVTPGSLGSWTLDDG